MCGQKSGVGRRRVLLGGAAAGALAFGGLAEARNAADIDHSVADALRDLFREFPDARTVASRSVGALVIPDILKAGFILGASYGEGALIIGGRTDSYWSYTAGSVGLQAGGQRTRLALFFMNKRSLTGFVASDGVHLGVDAEVTVIDGGADISLETTTERYEVLAYVFGRAGLLGGASYTGGKYRRIAR